METFYVPCPCPEADSLLFNNCNGVNIEPCPLSELDNARLPLVGAMPRQRIVRSSSSVAALDQEGMSKTLAEGLLLLLT